MRKRLLTFVLSLALCLPVFASCSGTPQEESTKNDQTGSYFVNGSATETCVIFDTSHESEAVSENEAESEPDDDSVFDTSTDAVEDISKEQGDSATETSSERETQKQNSSSENSKGLLLVLKGDFYAVAGIGSCTDRGIVIPKEYNGLPVKEICEYAFAGNTQITGVKLPSSITEIGAAAFYGCRNLKNVTLSNTLKNIGDMAFYDCAKIESIGIPGSLESLGNSVFGGCYALTNINYGSTLHKAVELFDGRITVPEGACIEISCSDGQKMLIEDYEDVTETPEDQEYFPDIERNDYGADFHMYFAPSTNVELFYMDDDTNDGSPMDEAVFARQQKVERYLGINIVQTKFEDAKFNDYNKYIMSAVMNMDGSVDALITHVNGGVGALISDNLLANLGDLVGIDLEAEYWNHKFMDTLKLKENYFLGFSDYNMLQTYVIAFNKDMLALYDSSMDKSLYDLVKDKEWTLDEMFSLASLVYTDKTGDGKSPDDTYGITGNCWVPFCGFLTSSNIPMITRGEDGKYAVALNQYPYFDYADTLVTKLKELASSNNAYFDYDYSKCSVPLTSGRTLMQIASTAALPSMLDYNVSFGVVPYPMYDLNQANVGYKSLQWGGYIGVLSYLKNPLMVGEALELLSFYSENVKITFYEKLLGCQVADMPDDAAMLDIIWSSVTADVGQTFISASATDDRGVCYTVPDLMWPSQTKDLSSYIKSKETPINEGFKKFLEELH